MVLRVYGAARFLLGVVVGTFLVGCTVCPGYSAYSGAYDIFVPYRSLFGINEYEAAGPSSSSTIVHCYTLRLEIRLDGGRGVSPRQKIEVNVVGKREERSQR